MLVCFLSIDHTYFHINYNLLKIFRNIIYAYHCAMDWIVFLQNSYGEVLIPNVTIFGDGAFRGLWLSKVTKVGPSSDRMGGLLRKGSERTLHAHTSGTAHVRTQREANYLQTKRTVLTRSWPCWQPHLRLWETRKWISVKHERMAFCYGIPDSLRHTTLKSPQLLVLTRDLII